MMKKYYSERFNIASKVSLMFLILCDILVPIMTFLPIFDDSIGIVIVLWATVFFHILLLSVFAVVFPFVGPSPSEKKSMEKYAQMYASVNGNTGFFDMNCVIPAKRRDCLDLPVKILLGTTAVHCIAMLVISLLSGQDMAQVSTVAVIIHSLCLIISPITAMSTKRKYAVIGGAAFIVIGILMLYLIFRILIDGTAFLPVLPLPIRIAVIIAAMLSNILFFRKTVYKGEFARNGEKVSR
ncbi:MAG: hypothetical protein ACI4I1_06045 [Oscillospiraceae bacterium]